MEQHQVLKGKRALVTGASRGIGRRIAIELAKAGARVVLSARSQEDLEGVVGEIQEAGAQGLAVPCDVTAVKQVAAMKAAALDFLGGVDVLVNNAGAADSHKFVDHPDELWHRMLAVNLTSAYYVSKAFAAEMLAQEWGRIITIASVASKMGARYIAAYTAAKHGVLGLTRALAVELAPHITVNAICPGYVNTPMTDGGIVNIAARTGLSPDEARARLKKTSRQNRLIEPEEIAAMTRWLAQEEARGITGQAISIDGGTAHF